MIAVLAGKELKALFASSLAWAVLALLQLMLAWIFLTRLDAFLGVQAQLRQLANPPGVTELIVSPLCASTAVLLLLAVPLLSMRLVAEERRHHTFALLMSAPLSMAEIVLGKFLGLFVFLMLIVALPALMALSLMAGGLLDWGMIAANLVGLVAVAASFAAIGLYVSCLTPHPAVAAFATLALLLGSWLINLVPAEDGQWQGALSLMKRFDSFNKGLFDSGDAVYFAVCTLLFLALAVRRLEGLRLRG